MAPSTPTENPKEQLEKQLQKLSGLIKKLPSTLPCGAKDGPIAKYFTDHQHDTSEGLYYTFNQAWERIFQVPDDQKELHVVRGKYGLELVHTYALHFSNVPGIEENDSHSLMAQRIEGLIQTIERVYVSLYLICCQHLND
jgi:hypothetical protein